MSVAETTVQETRAPSRLPHQQLALHTLVGGALLLVGVQFIFGGLPWLWDHALQVTQLVNEFLAGALLLMATLLVGAGLVVLFRKLERKYEQPGVRAGVVFAAFFLYVALWLTKSFGNLLETRELDQAVGIVLTLLALGGLGFVVIWLFYRPAFAGFLQRREEQGWFHATSFKGTQGHKVRRGTILAALVLGGCGIFVLVRGGSLGSTRYNVANDWQWAIPFASDGDLHIPLMYNVHLVLPIILVALLFWFCWRLVNVPTFADFLVATEAEMHKVSWTTRKRLVQDTVVVLVTVFLMTAFLFFVDILWIKVLSWKWINVLQVDIKAEVKKQQEKSQW